MALSGSRKDLYSGALFVVAGAYFALEAMTYEVGTPFRMGPGFMPLFLGAILCGLGVAVAAVGLRKSPDEPSFAPSWKAIALIIGTIVFFGLTIRGLGFVPVVVISAFATAMASKLNSILFSLILSIGLAVVCVLIFIVGLGLSVPLFGPWLGF